MVKPVDEILIYEITNEKSASLTYRVLRGPENFGSIFCFASSSNRTHLGYPFEIIFWALPQLLKSAYKDGNRLEVPSRVLDDLAEKMVSGSLFASDKPLEAELMGRYSREFPEGYRKHFG